MSPRRWSGAVIPETGAWNLWASIKQYGLIISIDHSLNIESPIFVGGNFSYISKDLPLNELVNGMIENLRAKTQN